ncbi:MAG: hypothetical protein IJI41_09665 [Anaerolineaceae bacterium]|nr:hypothetical protein [Anaerolineaceae bacterium]
MQIFFVILTVFAFALPFEVIDPAEISLFMPEHTLLEELSAFLPVLGKRMYPQCILLFVLFLFVYHYLLQRIEKKHFSVSAFLTAILFSFYLMCGEYGMAYKDLSVMFRTGPQCLVTGLKFAGLVPFFYVVVRAAFVELDKKRENRVSGKFTRAVFEKNCYLLPFLIILICWLPYVIAFFPGFVPSDGLKQLNNFFGLGNFTDNHPAFSSMLMGWAMRLGRKLGSDNLGIFLFTGPQLLINAAVMAGCFPLFKRLKTPIWLRRLTILNFALIPIWPNYAYSVLKDSLYMAMILLFVQQLIWIIVDAEKFCSYPGNLVLMIFSLMLMMFVRHEGQYVAAFVFLTLFMLSKPRRKWKKLIVVLLIPLCAINIFNRVIRPVLNIPDAPAREALTMPFRQTSAVVVNMEDDLTEEESAVLHEVFVYERIPEMYAESTENADALKGQFDPWAPKEAVARYMKVWVALGLRHPLTYLNVFLCSNTRYYDPFLDPYRDIYGWFGIESAAYVNQGLFDIHYLPQTAVLRSVLKNIAEGLPRLPLTSLFYSLGFNAWVMIVCFAYLLRKKIHGVIIPLLPGLITFVMLQNSAINGFFRYMLPLLITLPLSIAWVFAKEER